jgi:hypothetical protein
MRGVGLLDTARTTATLHGLLKDFGEEEVEHKKAQVREED